MIAPQLAAVRPRVVIPDEGPSLLVDEVAARLERGITGLITLTGPQGSGRTTALEHLEQVFLGEPRLLLVEDVFDTLTDDLDFKLIICTSPVSYRACEKWSLAPWTRDDCIEYLLAVHPERLASVVARIDERKICLGGLPELWRGVLDQLADDDSLPGIKEALRSELTRRMVDRDGLETARQGSFRIASRQADEVRQEVEWHNDKRFGSAACRWLRHDPVRLLAAADAWYARLRSGANWYLSTREFHRELIRETALLLKSDCEVVGTLRAILKHGPAKRQPAAIGLLHAAGEYCLSLDLKPLLTRAWLPGVHWSGADLRSVKMQRADFTEADLSEANLSQAAAFDADFTRTNLHGAQLEKLDAYRAKFVEADLRYARAGHAEFNLSDFRGARLEGAYLQRTNFRDADLRNANFTRANMIGADLTKSLIEGANFTAADLSAAKLRRLVLNVADFTGAQFDDADLENCDLEGMSLPGSSFLGANLQNALLTGTRIPEGKFRDADLRGAGLADIEWERADLRDADLRNCTFHLGSSRSGLVGSPLASEGTRTGFYTDELHEQDFKAPEEIRKANLRGADLRGADVEHTDFYLVDLRDARYTSEQEDHFRRTSAILEARV